MSRVLYVPGGEIELPDDPACAELRLLLAAQEAELIALRTRLEALEVGRIEQDQRLEDVEQVQVEAIVSQVVTNLETQETLQELNDQVTELGDQVTEESAEEEATDGEEETLIDESGSGQETGLPGEEESREGTVILLRVEQPNPEPKREQHTRFRRGR